VDILEYLKGEHDTKVGKESLVPHISKLIILDRRIDMITPILTQLTYEGLIDELIGISSGFVNVDEQMLSVQKDENPFDDLPKSTKKIKIPLNSNDSIYAKLRDSNFTSVGSTLHNFAIDINDKVKNRQEKLQTLESTRAFVQEDLKQLVAEQKAIGLHINITKAISAIIKTPDFTRQLEAQQNLLGGALSEDDAAYLEECIYKKIPLIKVLRLLCLYSQTVGIEEKKLEYLRAELLQSYGYDKLFTLNYLDQAGLFSLHGATNYSFLCNKLKLNVDEVNEQNPDDIAYVFSGYAPISIRLVELEFKEEQGWKANAALLNKIPGAIVEKQQKTSSSGLGITSALMGSVGSLATNNILVFFVGGVTCAEISAIRYLSKTLGINFLVGTTQLLNGTTFMQEYMESFK